MHQYYVYIMASKSKTLYVGVTRDLRERVSQHKQQTTGFTANYNITRLVYFEETNDVVSAIAREKQLKGQSRAKKMALVESMNPGWADLSESWFALDESQ